MPLGDLFAGGPRRPGFTPISDPGFGDWDGPLRRPTPDPSATPTPAPPIMEQPPLGGPHPLPPSTPPTPAPPVSEPIMPPPGMIENPGAGGRIGGLGQKTRGQQHGGGMPPYKKPPTMGNAKGRWNNAMGLRGLMG